MEQNQEDEAPALWCSPQIRRVDFSHGLQGNWFANSLSRENISDCPRNTVPNPQLGVQGVVLPCCEVLGEPWRASKKIDQGETICLHRRIMPYSLPDEGHLMSFVDQAVVIAGNLASSASQHPDLATSASIRNMGLVVSSILLAGSFPGKVEVRSISLPQPAA